MTVLKFPPQRARRARSVVVDEGALVEICDWVLDLAQRMNTLDDRLIKLESERARTRVRREKRERACKRIEA
jgi:hypothetical protein